MHRGWFVTSAIVLFAAPAGATPRVELRWRAAEGCLDEAALAATVERTLDQPVFHAGGTIAATLEGDVAKAQGSVGYAAAIVLRDRDGAVVATREIDTPAEDCSRLDDSLAVVVAMMVDGVREEQRPAPLRVPRAPLRQPRPRDAAAVTAEIEAGAALAIGLLPEASAGGVVRAGVGFAKRWSVALAGYGWSPSDAIELGSGARISAWAGELRGCGAAIATPRLELKTCVVLGVGFTDATPIALQGGSETKLPLAYDGVALDFGVRLGGPFWLRTQAALWNPFVAPGYYFIASDGTRQDLPKPWVIEPVFSIGLAARFGS